MNGRLWFSRRRLLGAALSSLAASPRTTRAQAPRVPIADMHSHYGLLGRTLPGAPVAEDMRAQRVAIVAWSLPADVRWIRATDTGLVQAAVPPAGALSSFFADAFEQMRAYLAQSRLRTVLGADDDDACVAGDAGVVLAHCTAAGIRQALSISKVPLVFSHGWVDNVDGRWTDGYGFLQRRLSLAQAKEIAAAGGVVGLWGLGLQSPGPSRTPGQGNWTVGRGDGRGYARELASLVDRLGEDHVAIGTDLHGVGASWSVNNYGHVRSVVETLQDMKLANSVIEKVAYANYARVLKSAMAGRRG